MSVVVSIIMTMKNTEDYVYDAVVSILNQTFEEFELIIVDDGSTDASREIVETFSDERIKIISGYNTGISDAFNLALKSAEGKYVCNCDADDLLPFDRLNWQVEWLELHMDYASVCGAYSSMDNKGKVVSQFNCGEKSEDISSEILMGITRTSLCTFLIKKNVLIELDGCRSYFVTAQDIDLQLRLGEKYKIWYEPIYAYFYRLHNSSITHTQGTNLRVFFENLARDFLKQRLEMGQDQLQKGMPPEPPIDDSTPTNSIDQIVGYLISESWKLHAQKNKVSALIVSIRACVKKPFSWLVWKNIIMVLIK